MNKKEKEIVQRLLDNIIDRMNVNVMSNCLITIKGTVMQIEKALINDRLRVLKKS